MSKVYTEAKMSRKKQQAPKPGLTQWAVPLLIASSLCLVLYFVRVVISGSWQFWFLNWNLLLAWLPVLLSALLVRNLRQMRWLAWQNLGLTALWVLFLPNTFYIVTDFVHLGGYDKITLLFDVVMLMTYALTGMALGWLSVYLVHKELKKRKTRDIRWVLLLLVFLLSSFAIYMGRNLGWNSWDAVTDPAGVIMDTLQRLFYPVKYAEAYSITALFFIFITGTYLAFYSLVKSLAGNEQ